VRSYAGSGSQSGDSAEDILCVFNFSQNPVAVKIRAEQFAGSALYDLFGGGEFPSFDPDGVVTLTLGTQNFYWLHIGTPGYVGSRP
jgi:maltose alpha-D-glucosyltransferase/alpha-amylase